MISDPQITNHVLMVRPSRFFMNSQTAVNNHFQTGGQISAQQIHERAIKQFDQLVSKLRKQSVTVTVVQEKGEYERPDCIFPNNWITFHKGYHYNLYPMYAPNRRLQRKIDLFTVLEAEGVKATPLQDYSIYEKEEKYLEGTGSMVLDRVNKIAYVALSPRSHQDVAMKFCQDNGYSPCFFKAYHTVKGKKELIYHTNVMMWIGQNFCGVCLQSIDDPKERSKVRQSLVKSNLQILQLSLEQINNFAGNSIMLQGKQKLVLMSDKAYNCLYQSQRQLFPCKILQVNVETIEKYGGGGARCMIAEIF